MFEIILGGGKLGENVWGSKYPMPLVVPERHKLLYKHATVIYKHPNLLSECVKATASSSLEEA